MGLEIGVGSGNVNIWVYDACTLEKWEKYLGGRDAILGLPGTETLGNGDK